MYITVSKIWFEDEKIFVELNDGRIVGVPMCWYPKLKNATPQQRSEFELWEQGKWIHWEELDEDLSAEGFLKYNIPYTIVSTE